MSGIHTHTHTGIQTHVYANVAEYIGFTTAVLPNSYRRQQALGMHNHLTKRLTKLVCNELRHTHTDTHWQTFAVIK